MNQREYLDFFRNNAGVILGQVRTAVDLLNEARVMAFLKLRATPQFRSHETTEQRAASAAYCAGYHAALNDLMEFKEQVFPETVNAAPLKPPEYGALNQAVTSNYITKEEAENERNWR